MFDDTIIEATTTVETREQALALGRSLVEQRLAACVQISGPIESVYRWQEKICQATEYRCTVKSASAYRQRLIEAVLALHPYDVPEVLVVDVADSTPAFAEWLRGQLG